MKKSGLKVVYILTTTLLSISISDSALGAALTRTSSPDDQKPLSTNFDFTWTWNAETINPETPNPEKEFTGQWWTATFNRLEFMPPTATQGSKIFIDLAGIHKNPGIAGHNHPATETFSFITTLFPNPGSRDFDWMYEVISSHDGHSDKWTLTLDAFIENNKFSAGTITLKGSHSVPEPSFILGLLTISTIGAGSVLKPKPKALLRSNSDILRQKNDK